MAERWRSVSTWLLIALTAVLVSVATWRWLHHPAEGIPMRPDGRSPEVADHDLLTTPSSERVAVLQQPTTVLVQVVDSVGDPIAETPVFQGERVLGRTNRDGRLSIQLNSGTCGSVLAVTPDGRFRSAVLEVDPGHPSEEYWIRLQVAPFRGQVLDESLNPVLGAEVLILPTMEVLYVRDANVQMRHWPITATTDAQGNFVFPYVPSSVQETRPSVPVVRYTISVSGNGYLPFSNTVDVRSGVRNRTTVNLKRAHQATISGFVVDRQSNPLGGASVRLMLLGQDGESPWKREFDSVMSENNGRFDIAFDLPADWSGFQYGMVLDVQCSGFAHRSVRLAANLDPLRAPVTIMLEKGLSISGRVTDDAGLGLQGAMVCLVSDDETAKPIRVETDADGEYVCNSLAPVLYDLFVVLTDAHKGRWKTTRETRLEIMPPQRGIDFKFTREK